MSQFNRPFSQESWDTFDCWNCSGNDKTLAELVLDEVRCQQCCGVVKDNLIRCTICQTAWYCCVLCKNNHQQKHTVFCTRYEQASRRLELSKIPLRHTTLLTTTMDLSPQRIREVCENSNHVEEYLCASTDLAQLYYDLAYEIRTKETWEDAKFHYQAVMVLHAAFHPYIPIRLTFVLLHLHRHDEAYAFTRSLLKVEAYTNPEYREGKFEWYQHANGSGREFTVERNCHWKDIFEDCTKLNELPLTAPYLLALVIIKLRIISTYEKESKGREVFKFMLPSDMIANIETNMMGFNGPDVQHQRRQLKTLLREIHKKEPMLLYALNECHCFAETLTDIAELRGKLDQYKNEIIGISLECGLRSFFRVPGAAVILNNFLEFGQHSEE
ncbi:hypothetical protein FisN_9Hu277 [Fistulifera solaris]|uniref:MYND-type domain-containing protein n=1 Tax=Fistulifera solaris TaxID=1519565 RepID=A0A1Z5JBB6_FISSO|nr:hypothetical protein FisN_9Hu277 [Fistulifera solaris]|eukprot:GAX11182.1 hypothetical protein FisN_9Hu277 [Fistulifera solaris]